MTYAKLVSVGDWSPHGIPVTVEPKTGERHVIMIEPEQLLYWRARLEAIAANFPKEVPFTG